MNDLTIYHQYRHLMKTGDPLYYQSKGEPLGWIIQKFTEYNHIGAVICFGADDHGADRVWTLEAIGKGVKPAFLSSKLEHYHGDVYWQPLDPKYDDRRHLILEAAMMLKDTDYDFAALFKNWIGYVSVNMNRLFCSEFWFVLMKYAKILDGFIAPRPGDVSKYNIYDPKFPKPVQIIKYEVKGDQEIIPNDLVVG